VAVKFKDGHMSTSNTERPLRILRRPEVEARTGYPTSTLYTKIQAGEFPRPIKLSARAVGWDERLVEEHIRKVLEGDNWKSLGDAAARVIDKTKSVSGGGR
jgi:prophage regulatory protein